MKIAVFGATGVLGQNLVPLLLRHGYHLLAPVRSVSKAKKVLPPKTEKLEYDLLEGEGDYLRALLEGTDCVVQVATSIPADFTKPGAWVINNKLRTEGT
ncbi:MAG: NAD(P)H-binding protein, partial [Ignavibacteriaceae bacterium]